MKLLSRLTPLAACLAMASPFAFAAEISYEARITNVAIGVIDLTPGDGVDAGYSFIGNGSTGYGVDLSQPGTEWQSADYSSVATEPRSYRLDGEDAFVNVSSTGRAGDFMASGSVPAPRSSSSYGSSGLNQRLVIELAPNTALAVSGHAFLSLVAQPGTGWLDTGKARIWVILSESSMPCCTHGSDYGRNLDLYGGGQEEVDEDFQVFMGNASGQARRIVMEIGLSGSSRVSPIPEPSTYGMLLAGLVVIGATARRAHTLSLSTAQKG